MCSSSLFDELWVCVPTKSVRDSVEKDCDEQNCAKVVPSQHLPCARGKHLPKIELEVKLRIGCVGPSPLPTDSPTANCKYVYVVFQVCVRPLGDTTFRNSGGLASEA